MNWKNKALLIIVILCLTTSCGIYSFTGASISSNVKTISIATFYNNSPLGPPNMSITFTEKLKDYFLKNTNLILVEEDGDLQFEGAIANYTLLPVAISASQDANNVDLASVTRLTVYVEATYVNLEDDTFDFDKTFSFFQDINQDEIDISSNEEELVEEIFDQIVIDIFNSSVANW